MILTCDFTVKIIAYKFNLYRYNVLKNTGSNGTDFVLRVGSSHG